MPLSLTTQARPNHAEYMNARWERCERQRGLQRLGEGTTGVTGTVSLLFFFPLHHLFCSVGQKCLTCTAPGVLTIQDVVTSGP